MSLNICRKRKDLRQPLRQQDVSSAMFHCEHVDSIDNSTWRSTLHTRPVYLTVCIGFIVVKSNVLQTPQVAGKISTHKRASPTRLCQCEESITVHITYFAIRHLKQHQLPRRKWIEEPERDGSDHCTKKAVIAAVSEMYEFL